MTCKRVADSAHIEIESAVITSKMIAKAITDDTLCNKTHTVMVVSGVLTIVALASIAFRAFLILREHLNNCDSQKDGEFSDSHS